MFVLECVFCLLLCLFFVLFLFVFCLLEWSKCCYCFALIGLVCLCYYLFVCVGFFLFDSEVTVFPAILVVLGLMLVQIVFLMFVFGC